MNVEPQNKPTLILVIKTMSILIAPPNEHLVIFVDIVVRLNMVMKNVYFYLISTFHVETPPQFHTIMILIPIPTLVTIPIIGVFFLSTNSYN